MERLRSDARIWIWGRWNEKDVAQEVGGGVGASGLQTVCGDAERGLEYLRGAWPEYCQSWGCQRRVMLLTFVASAVMALSSRARMAMFLSPAVRQSSSDVKSWV